MNRGRNCKSEGRRGGKGEGGAILIGATVKVGQGREGQGRE